MIELIRLALRPLRCEVIGSGDGRRGIELIRALPPDLVLLDLRLPGLDGREVYSAMKADSALKSVPVIVFSGQGPTFGDRDASPLPEACAYLAKPFRLADLRSVVLSLLPTTHPPL